MGASPSTAAAQAPILCPPLRRRYALAIPVHQCARLCRRPSAAPLAARRTACRHAGRPDRVSQPHNGPPRQMGLQPRGVYRAHRQASPVPAPLQSRCDLGWQNSWPGRASRSPAPEPTATTPFLSTGAPMSTAPGRTISKTSAQTPTVSSPTRRPPGPSGATAPPSFSTPRSNSSTSWPKPLA